MGYSISFKLAHPAATLYLFDYNFYFGTRTFVGSILTLLKDKITYQQIFGLNAFIYIAIIAAFVFLCLYSAKKAMTENNNILFLILIAFIVFPYSLIQYAGWIGSYDLYLCLFAVLSALTALSKRAHWLFPILCIMAIFTHYSFVLCYFPAVLSVHIYCIYSSENKPSRIASSALAFLSSFASTVYCVFFANNTIKMTRSELLSYMGDRLGMPASNERYIDAYYFNDEVADMIITLQTRVFNQGFIKNSVLFFLPIILFFCLLWYNCIIKTKKNQIFPYLCFLGTAAVNIALAFIIPEYPRWLTAATLSQFIIFFALMKKEEACVLNFLNRLNKTDTDIWFVIGVVVTVVSSLTITPYDVFQ